MSQKRLTASMAARSVSGVGMISSSRMYRGGLKKCVPNHERRKSSENPSAIFPTGNPLVLVVTMLAGLRTASTLRSSARLISRFSTTASIIQSTSPSFFKSSSKLPTVTRRASEASMNAAGLDFFAASSPAAAILFRAGPSASGGTMSNRKLGTPALANCAAMRAPMVPAPRTATLWICFIDQILPSWKTLLTKLQAASHSEPDKPTIHASPDLDHASYQDMASAISHMFKSSRLQPLFRSQERPINSLRRSKPRLYRAESKDLFKQFISTQSLLPAPIIRMDHKHAGGNRKGSKIQLARAALDVG